MNTMMPLVLTVLLAGCVPARLTDSTIQEQQRLVSKATETLDRVDVTLATVETQVAAVGSQAGTTLASAKKVTDAAGILLGTLVAAAGVGGGVVAAGRRKS